MKRNWYKIMIFCISESNNVFRGEPKNWCSHGDL